MRSFQFRHATVATVIGSKLRRANGEQMSPSLLSRHDAAGNYLYVSPSVRRLLGYEPDEILGKNAYELIVQMYQSAIRDSH